MPKWEYTVWLVSGMGEQYGEAGTILAEDGVWVESNGRPFLSALRQAGDDGWELCGVGEHDGLSRLVFKRPTPE